MEINLSKKVINGFNVTLLGKIINYFSQLIVTIVLARLIEVSDFGVIAICLMIVSFGQVLTGLGLGPALVQRKTINEKHIYTALISTFTLGLFIYLIALFTSGFVTRFYNIENYISIYIILCSVFLINTLNSFGQSLLQRNMQFKLISMIEIVSYVLGYCIIGITLAFLGYGIIALTCAVIFQSILKFIIVNYYVVKNYKLRIRDLTFDLNSLKEMLNFGVGYSIGNIAAYFSSNGDYIVVGKMFGENILAYYSRAYQLIALPANFLGHALDMVLFPILSKFQDDNEKLSKVYLMGINFFALVFIPLTVLIYVLAEEIILLLLGVKWIDTVPIFEILSVSIFFRMSYKLTDSVTRSIGIVNIRAILKIIYAALILISSFYGSLYGIEIVALLVGITIFINYVANNILLYIYIKFDVKEFIVIHLKSSLFSIALLVILYVINQIINIYTANYVYSFFLTVLTFSLFYILILLLFLHVFIRKDILKLFENSVPESKLANKVFTFLYKKVNR